MYNLYSNWECFGLDGLFVIWHVWKILKIFLREFILVFYCLPSFFQAYAILYRELNIYLICRKQLNDKTSLRPSVM